LAHSSDKKIKNNKIKLEKEKILMRWLKKKTFKFFENERPSFLVSCQNCVGLESDKNRHQSAEICDAHSRPYPCTFLKSTVQRACEQYPGIFHALGPLENL